MVIIISSSRRDKTNPNPEVTENVCLRNFEPLGDAGEGRVSYGGINEISVLDHCRGLWGSLMSFR